MVVEREENVNRDLRTVYVIIQRSKRIEEN